MKRLLTLLCALLLLTLPAQALEVEAPSAVLMERDTGTVLFEKDAHTPRDTVSVSMVMYLLLVIEDIES